MAMAGKIRIPPFNRNFLNEWRNPGAHPLSMELKSRLYVLALSCVLTGKTLRTFPHATLERREGNKCRDRDNTLIR
jgi:hypothetical protein